MTSSAMRYPSATCPYASLTIWSVLRPSPSTTFSSGGCIPVSCPSIRSCPPPVETLRSRTRDRTTHLRTCPGCYAAVNVRKHTSQKGCSARLPTSTVFPRTAVTHNVTATGHHQHAGVPSRAGWPRGNASAPECPTSYTAPSHNRQPDSASDKPNSSGKHSSCTSHGTRHSMPSMTATPPRISATQQPSPGSSARTPSGQGLAATPRNVANPPLKESP